MKRISAEKARDYFQERVKTGDKTMRDMADIVRAHPDRFSKEDIEKARTFLTLQMSRYIETMRTMLSVATPTEFSFDMDLPSVPQDAPKQAATVRPLAPETRGSIEAQIPKPGSTRPKPTGRLVGSTEVVIEEVPIAAPRRSALTRVDGVGFIEDAI